MKNSKIIGLSFAIFAVSSFVSQSVLAQETAVTSPASPITPSTQTTPAAEPVTAPAPVATPVAEPVPAPVAAPTTVAAEAIAGLNPIDAVPTGKGQVVFFRPARMTGMAVSFSVREGDTGIGKLTNGTYFVHVSDPGTKEYNISSEVKDTLRLEIEEGETYYVIQTIGMGVVMARPNLTPSTAAEFQNKKLKVTKATATDRK